MSGARGEVGSKRFGATKAMTRIWDFIPRKPVEHREHKTNTHVRLLQGQPVDQHLLEAC